MVPNSTPSDPQHSSASAADPVPTVSTPSVPASQAPASQTPASPASPPSASSATSGDRPPVGVTAEPIPDPSAEPGPQSGSQSGPASQQTHTPTGEPGAWDEFKAKILQEIEMVARFMDGAFEIPFLGQPIGADALAGLLPVGGDLLTAIVSGYIVVRARMMGVPKAKLWKMIGNIAIDTILGSVPIAGDAFDVYWKANFRNIDIVRAHFGLDPFQP